MSSSSSDDDDIPEASECGRLCKCFAEITGTDEALAQFYLQDRKWNLQKSVNDYLDDRKSRGLEPKGKSESEVVVVLKGNGVAAAANAFFGEPALLRESRKRKMVDDSLGGPSNFDPNILKCIVWNIDGLNMKNSGIRMKAVSKIILEEDADVVFLQEVIPRFAEHFLQALPDYECIFGNDFSYFNGTLLKKSKFRKEKTSISFFDNTRMGRHVIQVEGKLGEVPLCLINTHLESTKESEDERKAQLKQLFEKMAAQPSEMSVMCAGDMNLRDKELTKLGGLPKDVEDVWASCGSRKEALYTWDMTRNDNLEYPGKYKPRLRFDRIFFRRSSPAKLKPVFFGLIGLERLTPHRCFPSDHWGLLCHYEILQST